MHLWQNLRVMIFANVSIVLSPLDKLTACEVRIFFESDQPEGCHFHRRPPQNILIRNFPDCLKLLTL